MVKIPPSLMQRQIVKPPTVAEMRAARQPKPIPISPQQLEAQQQVQLETEIKKETQNVQSEIAKVEQQQISEMHTLNEKLDSANRRGNDASVQKYTDKIDEAQMFYAGKIGALNEGLNLLQQGNLYRAKDISSYAQQVGKAEKREEHSRTVGQQLRKEYLTKIKAQEVEALSPAQIKTEIAADPMLKVQYETYKSAGYSNIQAMLLAQESVKQQVSFTPEKAKEILGGLATADIDFNIWGQVIEPMSISPTISPEKPSLVSTALSIIRPPSYIGIDPSITSLVSGGVGAIRTFEERKAEEGKGVVAIQIRKQQRIENERLVFERKYEKEKLSGETKVEFVRRTKPKWYAGGSITQRYYELFGVDFYAGRERKLLTEAEIEKQDPIYTKKYQDAFEKKYLSKIQSGEVDYEEAVEEFIVSKEALDIGKEYETKIGGVAPISRWGNFLVQLTHFYAMFAFYRPLMKTATAKKAQQEVAQGKKMSQREALDKYIKSIKEQQARGINKAELRKAYARILKTGDSKSIENVEKVIKDLFGDKEAAREAAARLIRDVQAQEGYGIEFGLGDTRFSGLRVKGKIPGFEDIGKIKDIGITEGRIPTGTLAPTPKITIDFDITEVAAAPELEKLAEFALFAFPFREKEKVKEFTISKTALEQPEIMKEREKLAPALVPISASALLTGQTLIQPQVEIPRLAQPLLEKPRLAEPTVTVMGFAPTIPKIPKPPKAPPKIPKLFPFWFPSEKPKYIKSKPHYPEAFVEATDIRKAHWKRLSKTPMTKRSALSMASKHVDEFISARGRAKLAKPKIVKGKKVYPKKVLDTGEDYFKTQRHKFRTFKSKKGVRTKLKGNQFIELQKYRLDKPGETRGIEKGWGKRRTPFGF